jgi:hypothetical protein
MTSSEAASKRRTPPPGTATDPATTVKLSFDVTHGQRLEIQEFAYGRGTTVKALVLGLIRREMQADKQRGASDVRAS